MASKIEPPCGADHEKPNSDSELEHVTSQVQATLDEAAFDDMAMAAARRAADTHDEVHASGLASKAEMFGCANNSELFNLIADQHRVSAGIFAGQASRRLARS